MNPALGIGIGVGIGIAIGSLVTWLVTRSRAQATTTDLRIAKAKAEEELRAEREKTASLDALQERMKDTFTALAHQALTSNADQLLTRSRDQLESLLKQVRGDWGTHKQELKGLVDPLSKALDSMDRQVRALEQKREGAYGSLDEHLRGLMEAQTRLQMTTRSLDQSMRSPTARGKWGELQLRRVVELAGMQQHVDFVEQLTGDAGRPDMTINLPNHGSLPVDSKAPATAYLDAMALEPGPERTAKLQEHARALKERIRDLAKKEYWNQFDRSPEIVIMFVPFESALSAAFDQDSELLEFGIGRRVLIASPVTLLALLRAAAFGWQQHDVAENAREIAALGKMLHARFMKFYEHVGNTGKGLGKAVETYNQAVGSMERMLLPALRRLEETGVVTDAIEDVGPIEQAPRLPLDVEE